MEKVIQATTLVVFRLRYNLQYVEWDVPYHLAFAFGMFIDLLQNRWQPPRQSALHQTSGI